MAITEAPVFEMTGLYRDEDQQVRFTESGLMGISGYNNVSKKRNAVHKIKLAECARMWNGFMHSEIRPAVMMNALNPNSGDPYDFERLGKLAPHIFTEAMGINDFTNLTTYVLDRLMLENYGKYPFTCETICRIHRNVRDFRTVERWRTDGGELPWQQVGELEGFNRHKVSTSKYNYAVAKFEGGDQISWEATINDDMEMFGDMAERLATGGGRTNEQFYTKLIADANGPHASFYTSGNKNIIDTTNYGGGSVNPPLSYNALAGALAQFMNLMTAEGRPINAATDVVNVMVGDGYLYQVLMNIINTQMIATTVAGGSKASAAVMYDTQNSIRNWLSGRINPVYNPEIRNIVTASSGAVAAKSWWIFSNNTSGRARTAVEMGYLTGYDKPQLYRKLPNTVRISGGTADEMGDFETMATEIKGVIVLGGTRLDPKLTMASNGAGS